MSAAEAGPRADVQQGPSAARRRARIDQQRPAEATAGTALASWARWRKTEKFKKMNTHACTTVGDGVPA